MADIELLKILFLSAILGDYSINITLTVTKQVDGMNITCHNMPN